MEPVLQVENLTVKFSLRSGEITAVDEVDFNLDRGERLGLVGESGAGKSVTGFALINLISKPGYIANGSVRFHGRELTGLTDEQMRRVRGNNISMVFQDPMMTLNPVLTIGTQMVETLYAHRRIDKHTAEEMAVESLRKVHLPSPERRLRQYPHELSGGMRQRVVIAIALISSPSLIIADEPTTALDVTIQAEIMELLQELCLNEDMGLILITHDLAVVSQVAQRIAVMYAGRIVEIGDTSRIISEPRHPYTRGLLGALPQERPRGERLSQIPGVMPTLVDIPPGCAFNNRCTRAEEICRVERPPLEVKSCGGRVACHFVE
ncbi:MAG: ABC transporter ATP-binding protein [Thermodesulfobacteriota bacterium]